MNHIENQKEASRERFAAQLLATAVCAAGLLAAAAAGADTLDKTDCSGVVLDDSAFLEPIVRDQRDESFGALANRALQPLGGGEGYPRIVPAPPIVLAPVAVSRGREAAGLAADSAARAGGPVLSLPVLVRTADELRAALIGVPASGRTIYVDDGAEIDLTYCARTPQPAGCDDPRSRPPSCSELSLTIPANVTLASGRGRLGSRGALLASRTFTTCPLLVVGGAGVRITGLRIQGPDSSIENDDPIHCGGEAFGIGIRTSDGPQRWETEVDNNELSAWPAAAVSIDGVQGVRVHHNLFQFNRRQEHNGTCDHDYGLGYGVVVGPGSVTVEANVFDHNRHDIASDGAPGSFYTATYNLVLAGAVQHSFDVHGGKDRKDCTNVAGSGFVVHHNTFLQAHKPAVRLRGIPMRGAWIYHNETRDDDTGDAFNQVNSHGNFHALDNRTHVNRFPAWFASFGGSTFWQWRQFESTPMSAVAAGDFNGDGVADVMRVAPTGWQWSQSGREGWAFLNSLTDPLSNLRLGDFVGGGLTDVVRATGSAWQVSEGGTSPWRTLMASGASLSSAAFGDFEGDGHTDAFFADGNRWTIIQSFSPLVRRHHDQPFRLVELRFGNFTGDPKLDVVRSTGSEWLVWDHASRAWSHLNTSAIPLSRLTFADFDGDGFTDVARSSNGQWLVSWGGRSRWSVLNTSALDIGEQLIADLNGDRKADVLSLQSPDP